MENNLFETKLAKEKKSRLYKAIFEKNLDLTRQYLEDEDLQLSDHDLSHIFSKEHDLDMLKILLFSNKLENIFKYLTSKTSLINARTDFLYRSNLDVLKLCILHDQIPKERRESIKRRLKYEFEIKCNYKLMKIWRRELDLEFNARLFALIVMYCDGYLELKSDTPLKIIKFFKISSQLPMEIQMCICNRRYKLPDDYITGESFEMGLVKFL